jgi:hypothetical protein
MIGRIGAVDGRNRLLDLRLLGVCLLQRHLGGGDLPLRLPQPRLRSGDGPEPEVAPAAAAWD